MGLIGTAIKANPLGAGLTAASVAGQLFGAIKGGQANRASQRLLNERKEENEAYYNNEVKRDYLETNSAKGMVETLRKNLKDSNKVAANTAAVTGGTAEATIAAKSKNQENYNAGVSNIAEKGTNYKLNQTAMYKNEKAKLDNAQANINSNKAESASNLVSNAASLGSAAANTLGKDKFGQSLTTGEIKAGEDTSMDDPYRQKMA